MRVNKMNIRKRKAISPLITTLLLIAIAVAASVLTYSWVMSMVGSQSAQAQTQVRIDSVDWGATPYKAAANYTIQIRNTGSVSATIESVQIKENKAGMSFKRLAGLDTNPKSLDIGDAQPFEFTGLATTTLSTSYIIRVTTTTGFYYEMVATTPAA